MALRSFLDAHGRFRGFGQGWRLCRSHGRLEDAPGRLHRSGERMSVGATFVLTLSGRLGNVGRPRQQGAAHASQMPPLQARQARGWNPVALGKLLLVPSPRPPAAGLRWDAYLRSIFYGETARVEPAEAVAAKA